MVHYICRECSYEFPSELSHLIDNNIQVYCERCGSPFVLEGVTFKPAQTPYIREKKQIHTLSERKSSNLEGLIQFLNKISFIPLFLFTCISFGLIAEYFVNWNNLLLFDRIMNGLFGLFLLIYDRVYLSRKVKEKEYNDIFLDSFCWGILGCILYGIGVIVLLKGIAIVIYVITDSKNVNYKTYNFGLLAKNSLNNLSSKAGFFIVLLGIYRIYSDRLYLPKIGEELIYLPFNIIIPIWLLFYSGFLLIALAILLIDSRMKIRTKEKQMFVIKDSAKYFVMGIFGILFYAAGIFILLKSILIFFLCFGKPSKKEEKVVLEQAYPYHVPIPPTPPSPPSPPHLKVEGISEAVKEEEQTKLESLEESIEIKKVIIDERDLPKVESKEITEIFKKELEEIPIIIDKKDKVKREEEFQLKLHDSLLPVKDDKDKKLVKEYFSKIFAVLSKDLRAQINDLKITKKEKKELLEELAFLTKQEQIKYIEAIVNLYKEIPKKLINRIRKLPNVKPKHYDKIVEQLRYMDYDEQIKFVQFLEENA
ncbi:MAG: hypothetical protein ACFFEY_03990 [Candidatus Thorarchaeota archaeon]